MHINSIFRRISLRFDVFFARTNLQYWMNVFVIFFVIHSDFGLLWILTGQWQIWLQVRRSPLCFACLLSIFSVENDAFYDSGYRIQIIFVCCNGIDSPHSWRRYDWNEIPVDRYVCLVTIHAVVNYFHT